MKHPVSPLAYGRPICCSRAMHPMIAISQTATAPYTRSFVLAGNHLAGNNVAGNNNNRANNNANFWRADA